MHHLNDHHKKGNLSRTSLIIFSILVAFQLTTRPNECHPTNLLEQTAGPQVKPNDTQPVQVVAVVASATSPKLTKTPAAKSAGDKQKSNCDYDKSKWTECNQAVGCKYLRGEWSAQCVEGRRTRVDTLVGALGKAANCRRERRVTKDCRRACHYIKSAWSECSNGVRTRNLTLDESTPTNLSGPRDQDEQQSGGRRELLVSMAPPGQHCERQKLVRRHCRTPGQRRNLKQQRQQLKQVATDRPPLSPMSTTLGTLRAQQVQRRRRRRRR